MIDLSACPISLDPSERQKLEELARQLPLIAELSACELFIDCVGDDGGVVVAHAWSNQLGSFYAAPAVGKHVSEEKEPAVFAAWRTGLVQRDLKAVTQEDRTVWQDVVPVYGSGRRCIALLIREKDISERVARDKNMPSLPSPTPRKRRPSVTTPAARTMRSGSVKFTTASKTTCKPSPVFSACSPDGARTRPPRIFYEKMSNGSCQWRQSMIYF